MRQQLLIPIGLLTLAWSAAGADEPSYRVAVDRDLTHMAVTACFPAEHAGRSARRDATRLAPLDEDATAALISATATGGKSPRPLELAHDALMLPPGSSPGAPDCLTYDLKLGAPTDSGRSWRGLVYRAPGAVLVSPHLFLWTPPAGIEQGTLTFDLPAGLKVSAPWPESAPGSGIYRLGARPLEWDARVAIGQFDTLDLELSGGRAAVALLGGDPPADAGAVRDWLLANTRALARIGGARGNGLQSGPGPVQVLVVPIGRGGEPVPWGEVMRGGGDALHLYIDQTRPAAEFMGDWVLIHELSHLLHPKLDGAGRWLYEGLASYYQEVLRARAGLLSEDQAWQRLHRGFERGRAGTRPGRTLEAASDAMLRERAFMQVYWSGAAIALLADLELRRSSGGRQSLDSALLDLRRRFGPFDRAWSPRELIDALDVVTGGRVFATLADRWLPSDRFPRVAGAYRTLGLTAVDAATIRPGGDAQATELRRQIMGGGSPGR